MRMIIGPPAGWTVRYEATRSLVSRLDGAVEIEITSLHVPAEPPHAARPLQTRDGWTMRWDEASLLAVYEVPPWTAIAQVRLREPHDELRDFVLALLVTARPHLWSDQPACVAELWDAALP